MERKTFFITVLFITGLSCSQPGTHQNPPNKSAIDSPLVSQKDSNSQLKNYFPFEIYDDANRFTVVAGLQRPEVYPKYADFFAEFGYEGNGYCWEGHITQILEKIQPDLLQRTHFDPEAGGFYAHFNTKEDQLKFVALLSPVFSDFTKLAVYVKNADRSRIDD
ncbi:MAG: Imm51 family immunity protein [Bacteroidota bacterium]